MIEVERCYDAAEEDDYRKCLLPKGRLMSFKRGRRVMENDLNGDNWLDSRNEVM